MQVKWSSTQSLNMGSSPRLLIRRGSDMKLSIPRACGSWCKSPPVSTTLHKPISFYSSIPSSSPLKPQVPLFLRPPIHSATLSDLQIWHHWAKTLPVPHSDDPPDPTLLRRELKWLLEDALEVHSSVPQMGSHSDDRPIKLRTSLEQLYSVWRQRIEERRPFQYVVGCEHWRDLVLSVQDGVLIPRPETEVFVDLVGDVVTQNGDLTQGLWADLGTGSGAIAIGIGRILGPRGRVIATDLSPVAVSVASFNVQRYSLQDIIEIRQGSWFEPLKDVEGKLSGLVSNPPYIPSDHISGLQPEVGWHEPRLALDGGVDGIDALLHLCNGAASMLKPGGFFIFETNGEKQCKFLVDYMENESKGNFYDVKIVPDFAGIQRFVTGFHH